MYLGSLSARAGELADDDVDDVERLNPEVP